MKKFINVENTDNQVKENEIWLMVLEITGKDPDYTRVVSLSGAVWLFYATGNTAGIIKLNVAGDNVMSGIRILDHSPGYFDRFVDHHSVDINQYFPHLEVK